MLGLLSPSFSHIFQKPLGSAAFADLAHSAGNLHSGNLWALLECSSYLVSEVEISYTASHLLHLSSLILLNYRRNGPFQI